jgi:hypothetical protein
MHKPLKKYTPFSKSKQTIMRKVLLALTLFASVYAQAQLSPAITSWIQNPDTNANRGYANIPSNVEVVQYSTSDVYVSCTWL